MHPLNIVILACILAVLPMLTLLAVRGPVDGKGDPAVGYWGEKTASVNWCEADYAFTPHVAELGNALTSLTIVLNGVYGLWSHWKTVELRYLLAFLSFIVVGFGSCAFHATLQREYQLLDELPMIWANGVFIFCVICMEDARDKARTFEANALLIVNAAATLAVTFFDKDDQTIFLVCYGSGVAWLFYSSHKLNQHFNSAGRVSLMETSSILYLGGFFLWLLDRNFCEEKVMGLGIRSMYLHCFWHLAAGSGTFTMVLFWIWTRNVSLGVKQRLRGRTPATMWVEMEL